MVLGVEGPVEGPVEGRFRVCLARGGFGDRFSMGLR